MKTNEAKIGSTEITLTDGKTISVMGTEAQIPAQIFVRVSKNLVAGIETEKNTHKDCGRVRFFRNLGTVYDYAGHIFIKEENDSCVLFDICVSQPENPQEFTQKAFEIQKAETEDLKRKAKVGHLSNQIKILARPYCA